MGQKVQLLKRQLFDLRMQQAGGKLDKPHQIRQIRREIARMKTLVGEAQNKEGSAS